LFAERYRGRNVIFAYDLKNEPELAWESPALQTRWNEWVRKKYPTEEAVQSAWKTSAAMALTNVAVPSDKDALRAKHLLDYQDFRESVADEWTRRQAVAIRKVDPGALVTVGLIQWSVPAVLPGSVRYYSAFRPERQAKFLDFMEIHFYPLANGAFEYRRPEDKVANLAYAESIISEVARYGKPVVLAEFGWYGGGKPKFDAGKHPAATEAQHADYCRSLIETTAGFTTGWLNWGFYDQPEATDCSELTGLMTADGSLKMWGTAFHELTQRSERLHHSTKQGQRPTMDWEACITSTAAARDFQRAYLQAFQAQVP
jgi:endo-1,4-beta-mannosidase